MRYTVCCVFDYIYKKNQTMIRINTKLFFFLILPTPIFFQVQFNFFFKFYLFNKGNTP